MPNQNQNNTPNPMSVFPQADLPPLPPSFQEVSQGAASSAPGGTPPSTPPVISSTPKKKFGGGRIIATILGILLLVGGVGAGFVLTQQQQLFQQKARVVECVDNSECSFGYVCSANQCVPVSTPAPTPKPPTPAPTPVSNPKNPNPICSTNSQCPSGQVCIAGRCQTPTPECTTNADCSGGKVCVANSCQFECTTNTDCGSGQTCVANKCQAGGGGGGGTTAQCINASLIKCDANGCTVGSNYRSSDPTCFVMKYHCNDVKGSGVSCDQLTGATLEGSGASESFSADCGTEQIDINCGACGIIYPAAGQQYFTSKRYASACGGGGGGGTISASCQSVKAYDSTWILLTSTQLSALSPGTTINFCVGGIASSGSFDKAKFTINSVTQPETTTKRPASEDFCQSYQVPTGVSSFNVSAQIHHVTLGWSL